MTSQHHATHRIWNAALGALVATLIGCSGAQQEAAEGVSPSASSERPVIVVSATPSSTASTTAAPSAASAKPLQIDPPLPEGVPVPRGVRLVDATDGGGRAAYLWLGTFAADPSSPALHGRVEKARLAGEEVSLGLAALYLYRDDAEAAGDDQTLDVGPQPGFYFNLRAHSLSVSVRILTNDPYAAPKAPAKAVADEHGPFFEIYVGPIGG